MRRVYGEGALRGCAPVDWPAAHREATPQTDVVAVVAVVAEPPDARLSLKVVDGDSDPARGQVRDDQRFDVLPATTSKTAADPRHMDRRAQPIAFVAQLRKTTLNRVVPDRWVAAATLDAVLPDHVRDPDLGFDLHQLYGAETEVIICPVAVPVAVCTFRLRPPAGHGDHEASAPRADVVAQVSDDGGTRRLRLRRVARDNVQRRHRQSISERSDTTSRMS